MNTNKINVAHNKIIALKQNIESARYLLNNTTDSNLINIYSNELENLEQLLKEWSQDFDNIPIIEEMW